MMMMMMMMMMTMIVPMGFTHTSRGKTPHPPKPAWAKEIIADFCITPQTCLGEGNYRRFFPPGRETEETGPGRG